jgi:hypothetical protein
MKLKDHPSEEFYSITMKIIMSEDSEAQPYRMANMNVGRTSHAMNFLNKDFLYVVGGINSSGELAVCEEYNVATNKWTIIASLNEKKKWVSLCSYGGKFLYAFGGICGKTATEAIEFYDAASTGAKYWTPIKLSIGKEFWNKRFFSGVVSYSEDCIMVFGGVVNEKETDECLGFNPKTNALTKMDCIVKPDTFQLSKPKLFAKELYAVGSMRDDMHKYIKEEKKWKLMPVAIWDPIRSFDVLSIKSDTC